MDLERLRQQLATNNFELSQHAERERQNDRIRIEEVREAAATLELLEDYPTDPRGPSCLVGGTTRAGRFLHLVAGNLDRAKALIITLYDPAATDPHQQIWEADFRIRRRRQPHA
jgi:hypothetical protein